MHLLSFIFLYSIFQITSGMSIGPDEIFCGEESCYAVLGIKDRLSVTTAQISKIYRQLALEYHPDKNPSKEAQEMFLKVQHAHSVLSDPESRDLYDYYLDHPEEVWRTYGRALVCVHLIIVYFKAIV